MTTGGRDEVVEALTVVTSAAGRLGLKVRPDLLGSVGSQAAASCGASVAEACGWDGATGPAPEPELLPALEDGGWAVPAWESASTADEGVGTAPPLFSTATALVTGTTVRIWAVTPFMTVWMVVGTVTTVKVVEAGSGFPWFLFDPPFWVGVSPICNTVVLTGTRVVIGKLPTTQLVAPGGHLVSVYVVVESVLN